MLLNSGVTQVLWLVSKVICGPVTQSPAEWRIPSSTESSWNTPEMLVFILKLHMQMWNDLGVPKLTKGGIKKKVKGFVGSFTRSLGRHWFWQGSGSGCRLKSTLGALSVWSMSPGIATSGEVIWQTGLGHRMVLRTSIHSYINRIKMSDWSLLASSENSGGRSKKDFDKTWTDFKRQKNGGRIGGFKDDSVSHDI